jgi:hypothetical protein
MAAEVKTSTQMPINLSQEIAEHNQSLACLDERIYQAELRRDYPPSGCNGSDPVVQEELRALYVGQARLLQIIQLLNKDLLELNLKETSHSVLETARIADAHAVKNSGPLTGNQLLAKAGEFNANALTGR